MARKIVVTSGKGGVGKTTVCANLAVQLARKGNRVIACDLDFGLNNLDVVLGMENMATYDVIDAIEGRCRAKQVLVRHPWYPTLYTVNSHPSGNRYVSPQAVRLVLDTLSPQFDFVLIDSPAGIEEGFHRAVCCAEEAIIVTTPHISAMRDADRVAALLKSYSLSQTGLVVNLVRKDFLRKGDILSPKEISEMLHLPLFSVIAEEDKIYLRNIVEHSVGMKTLADYFLLGRNRFGKDERGKKKN